MAPEDPFRATGQRDEAPTTYPGFGPPAGPGQVSWGPPPSYSPQETSSQAIVALVLAIASFVILPVLPAIVALVLARRARTEIGQSGGRLNGLGLAHAAAIVSWINLAVAVLVIVGLIGLVVAFTHSTDTTF